MERVRRSKSLTFLDQKPQSKEILEPRSSLENFECDSFVSSRARPREVRDNFQITTQAFLANMIAYCLSEIQKSIEMTSITDFCEAVEQLTQRLGTVQFPLEMISTADKKEMLRKLNQSYKKSNLLFDGKAESELSAARTNLDALLKKIKGVETSLLFSPPMIEDRSDLWNDPAQWGPKMPEAIQFYQLPRELSSQNHELENYEIWPISNDGGCWARSLWHVVLSKVLDDPARFKLFTEKIKKCVSGFSQSRRFFQNNDVSDLLGIMSVLSKLKNRPDRIAMLCHEKVDLTLQIFVRKLVTEIFRRANVCNTIKERQYIDKIELLSTYGGAHEINCFANYFGLTIQEIAQVNRNGGETTLQFHTYNTQHSANEPRTKLDDVIMYGSSSIHYEVLYRTSD